jgi:Flp pilus assembly pilin Flp
MFTFPRTILRDRAGSTSIEYALIASLIAVAIVVSLEVLSGTVSGLYTMIAGSL